MRQKTQLLLAAATSPSGPACTEKVAENVSRSTSLPPLQNAARRHNLDSPDEDPWLFGEVEGEEDTSADPVSLFEHFSDLQEVQEESSSSQQPSESTRDQQHQVLEVKPFIRELDRDQSLGSDACQDQSKRGDTSETAGQEKGETAFSVPKWKQLEMDKHIQQFGKGAEIYYRTCGNHGQSASRFCQTRSRSSEFGGPIDESDAC